MIVCPNCNHPNPDGAVQCEACYTPLPATTHCPSCGASVQADAAFCGQCGYNLHSSTVPHVHAPVAATVTPDIPVEVPPLVTPDPLVELLQPDALGISSKEIHSKIVISFTKYTGQYFVEDLGNGVELEMVLINGGTFKMGAPKTEEDSYDNERPQHQVTVPTFFMGKYPITQAQWKDVAALSKVNRDLEPDPSKFKGDNRPVEQVSWYDAVEFCDRLAAHTKRQYCLPSEAEWEYACRAGTITPFHFGETITSELGNYDANYTYGAGEHGTYREETTVVASFEVANAFGLYDMHGNVDEWCLDDWHNNYEGAPTDSSPWFDNNDNLFQKQGEALLRGGSWKNHPKFCRSAYRSLNNRDNLSNSIGFRVVCGAGRIY